MHFLRPNLKLVEDKLVKPITSAQIRTARAVAIGADCIQILLFPLFAEGFISPIDDALDLVVCVILCRLVGWHFGFLPSFAAKLVPMVDMVPTWTIAVLLATRSGATTLSTAEATASPTEPRQANARVVTD